jgi:hypothetical protein
MTECPIENEIKITNHLSQTYCFPGEGRDPWFRRSKLLK